MKYTYYILTLIILIIISYFVYTNFFKNKITNLDANAQNKNNSSENNLDNKKQYKIVAFGDSLTAGYGVDLADSYPAILEEKLNISFKKVLEDKNLNIKVINMGVSGETTTGGLERVDFVISQNPDLVLLGLGANDMLRATDPSIAKDNLNKIIKGFTDKNISIILLGMESQVSNGLTYKRDFDEIYTNLSEKYNILLVPFFLKGVALVPKLNTSDGIHPNRTGYEKIIGENILPVLLPFLEKEILTSSSNVNSKVATTTNADYSSFFPELKTYLDSKYLHVESDGIAKHSMMTGIINWQQQFPLPQSYTDNNSWSIPLYPTLSLNPISTKNNLYRGAIALAANGVPIFNALNNRGEDAFLAGELDDHGGHAGKGDDYHYHTAPIFLEDSLSKGMPIAYALDGYKVYADTEPDGKMFTGKLDECNGHTYSAGTYHYHGVKTYPYMIGCMKGNITVKQEQIDPQPKANPLRPAGEPLRGAIITNFKTVGQNSYSLEYTLDSKKYIVDYKLIDDSYVFEYINPDGTKKTETYTIK